MEAMSVKFHCSRVRNWAGVSFQQIAQSVVSPFRMLNPLRQERKTRAMRL